MPKPSAVPNSVQPTAENFSGPPISQPPGNPRVKPMHKHHHKRHHANGTEPMNGSGPAVLNSNGTATNVTAPSISTTEYMETYKAEPTSVYFQQTFYKKAAPSEISGLQIVGELNRFHIYIGFIYYRS